MQYADKKCLHCNEPLFPDGISKKVNPKKQYCSANCKVIARNYRIKRLDLKTCKYCGGPFEGKYRRRDYHPACALYVCFRTGDTNGKGFATNQAHIVLKSLGFVPSKICDCCGVEKPNLVIDHDHVHHSFRGFICRGCNTYLSVLDKGEIRLSELKTYLDVAESKYWREKTNPDFADIRDRIYRAFKWGDDKNDSFPTDRVKRFLSEMNIVADGQCECCRSTDKKVVIDHCHIGHYFRGFICERCNLDLKALDKGNDLVIQLKQYLWNADHLRVKLAPPHFK